MAVDCPGQDDFPTYLRSTCVRPADDLDAPALADAGVQLEAGEGQRLVLGQPAFAAVRVRQVDGQWWLDDVRIADPVPDPTMDRATAERMLLQAGYGLALDDGATSVVTQDAAVAAADPQFSAEGAHMWRRPIADTPEVRPATSVVPLRQRAGHLEVFIQHRTATMEFVPGAVVFPGGRVDHLDGDPHGPDPDRVHRRAGVRELAEETGLRVAPDSLVPWDRWITPVEWNRRYDVHFYLLGLHDEALGNTSTESHTSEWISLHDLAARVMAGHMLMVPPTRSIVDELQRLGTLERALSLRPDVTPVRHDLAPRRPRPGR